MRKTSIGMFIAAFALAVCFTAAAEDWKPTKEITMIVPSSAGGGSDLNARTITSIVQKYNLCPTGIMVVNNGGGSGAVGFTNTFARKGDDHVLMILHSGQAMGSYVNNWKVKTEDLTYVATVALDNLFFCVRTDSPYNTLEDFVAASKKEPEELAVGGAQRGNSDHLSFELFNKNTNAQSLYVSFNGSGDVMSALLGGHVNAAIFNPIECIGQLQAGTVKPLASLSPQRVGGIFKDVPTFTELGYPEVVVVENRAISMPPDVNEAAVKFYSDMLRKVTETPEWKKDYIEKNYLGDVFYDYKETGEFYTELIKGYKVAFDGVKLEK